MLDFQEKPNRGEGMIESVFDIEHVSFSYGGKHVINGISTKFRKGVFYGIMGPNGCGKTTFLDLISGHSLPDSGNIIFSGKALNTYSKPLLSQQIALVAQNYYINFPYTVMDVVMMGRYPHIPRFSSPVEADYKMVEEAMELTGVYKLKNHLVTELSGGERQRVVFARALAQETGVLLLDEATSNLDISYTIALLDVVKKRVEENGLTIVSVFQDINFAAVYCDELIFMNEGTIVASGTTDEMMNESLLEKVFKVKSEIRFEPLYQARQAVFKTGVH